MALYYSNFVEKLKSAIRSSSNDVEVIPAAAAAAAAERIVDWKIALYGFCFSLIVVCAKVFVRRNRDDMLRNVAAPAYNWFVGWSWSADRADADADAEWMRMDAGIHWSSTFVAVVCGLVVTAFTWLMIYLDSSLPGVQPPTPFSPTKYKLLSGHSFHLGYIIAIVNGLLVSIFVLYTIFVN